MSRNLLNLCMFSSGGALRGFLALTAESALEINLLIIVLRFIFFNL